MGGCLAACCADFFDLDPEVCKERVDLTHFHLHRVLGRGGFGKVQVCESRLNGDMYALKSMDKAWLVQSASNTRSVWLERHIMVQLRSNFLVHTYFAFQDAARIYLCMQFLPGGDLHFLLHHQRLLSSSSGRDRIGGRALPLEHVKFYMAEILLGLEEMHSCGLVYRDLKPENVLLDSEGHVRLSDFGLAGDLNSELDGMTVGACGTNGYMSQELLANMRYDFTPDVYAFGVVMYELLHVYPPVAYNDPSSLEYASKLTPESIELMVALLQHDPVNRIGCDTRRQDRWQEVKDHPFFADIDWEVAAQRGLHPPFKPIPNVANCDPMFELEEQLIEPQLEAPPTLSDEQQAIFRGWDWHTEPHHHSAQSNLTSFTPTSTGELMPDVHTLSSDFDMPVIPSPSAPVALGIAIDEEDEDGHWRSRRDNATSPDFSRKHHPTRRPHSDQIFRTSVAASQLAAPVSASTPLRPARQMSSSTPGSMELTVDDLAGIHVEMAHFGEDDEEQLEL